MKHIKIDDIFVFVILFLVLLGPLLFLLKVLIIQISDMRQSHEDNITISARMAFIIVMIFVSIGLIAFVIILCFFPNILNRLSIAWKLIGLFGVLVYWGCFAGIALGAGSVVGAGYGSATSILKKLSSDISKSVRVRPKKEK